ncbi:hypothetical protein TWF706_005144 [Orbilia oligospora]|nr:hypothetical protein TWF706_005144 [Orbilia oligospora]
MRKYLTFITIIYTCCAAHTGLACCRINERSKPRQRTSARPPPEARSLSRTGTFGLNEDFPETIRPELNTSITVSIRLLTNTQLTEVPVYSLGNLKSEVSINVYNR